MYKILAKYKYHWGSREFRRAVFSSFFLFIASLIVQHFATDYADLKAGNYVHDIILDNFPVVNVDDVLNYGVQFFGLFIIGCLFFDPKRIPFVFKSLALFFLIRSFAITLTHLGPAPVITNIDPHDLLADLVSGNDFFFSGHTGAPFLLALIFWNEKWIRNVSLVACVVFASAVLLGHLHYSIDVFAAFFITYTIFHLAMKFFPNDYKLFQHT